MKLIINFSNIYLYYIFINSNTLLFTILIIVFLLVWSPEHCEFQEKLLIIKYLNLTVIDET